jgi:hypothetical protein
MILDIDRVFSTDGLGVGRGQESKKLPVEVAA